MGVSPQPVLDLLDGFRRSKVLFAAVSLQVFDGVRPPGESGQRLLDACVSLGLLERRGARYVNTATADEYLCEKGAHSLAPYVRYSNCVLYPAWGELEDVIAAGKPRLSRRLLATEDRRLDFVRGMEATGRLSAAAVAAAFDLARFNSAVDLGGATGYLAVAARRWNPNLGITVFEHPVAINAVRQAIAPDIELVTGDFHVDPLPPADLYILGRVLHNLSDAAAERLLQRVCAVLPDRGAVLIAERLVPTGDVPPSVHIHSLNMLVCTGGRERTTDEYVGLLRRAGFGEVGATITGSSLDAILASKS